MAIRLDTNSFIEHINSAEDYLFLEKGIAKEDIVIKQFNINSSLTIKDSKFQKSLTFIKCKFNTNIHILNTTFDMSITFMDCEINGDINIYHTNAKKSIEFIGCNIKGTIKLEGIESNSFKITTTSAKSVELTGDINNKIINFVTINTTIDTSLKVQKLENLENFELNNVSIPNVIAKSIDTKNEINFTIKDSRIDDCSLEKINFASKSILLISQNTFNNLSVRNNKYNNSNIGIHKSLISGLLTISGINQEESKFDISTATILNLKLDNEVLSFISKGEKKSIFLSDNDLLQRVDTLKIFKNYFASEHLYEQEDKCFYFLKNEESKYLLEDKNIINFFFMYSGYSFNRYIFGWGVKIINPIFSAIVAIVLFLFYYYINLKLYKPTVFLEYLDNNVSGFNAAGTLATLSFLGQYSDVKFHTEASPYIFISEYILGMTLTTIIVGILIRKLVR